MKTYNLHDFLNGSVTARIANGLKLDVDQVFDKSMNSHFEIWVSELKSGETVELVNAYTETDALNAIINLSQKYSN